MRIWSSVALFLVTGAAALSLPATGEAQLVVLDNFGSGLIDPSLWFGSESTAGPSSPTAESNRFIKGGQLDLLLRQYGRADSDSGNTGGTITLNLVDPTPPTPITTWQADVKVKSSQVDTCPTNGAVLARARAQVEGGFFNDGTSTGPSDRTGDIGAGIQMVTDSILGNVFQAFVFRCTNSTCGTSNTFLSQTLATTWTAGQRFTMSVTWDAADNQFAYSVAKGKRPPETVTNVYSQSDSNPAVVPFRFLRISNTAANCNGSHMQAFMEAQFDNVMVNP